MGTVVEDVVGRKVVYSQDVPNCSSKIKQAFHPFSLLFFEHMGIDHCRLYALMSQKFLYRAQINTTCSKCVA